MSKAQHTPGPWRQLGNKIVGQFGKLIVRINQDGWTEEDRANALLIAAAPDMKDAGNDLHAALFDLRKAYADVQEHYGFKPEQSPQIVAAENALKKWTAALAKAGAA